ncbi:MAG: O-antigen ligase family protein, partial [Gaiellaceae bacterium]
GILAVVFVRRPAFVPPAVLLAAPLRMPVDFHGGHVGLAHGGQVGRLLPLYGVLAAAAIAFAWRLVRGDEHVVVTREIAVPVAAFVAFASISYLWTTATAPARNLLEYFLLPFVVLVAVVARSPFPTWAPRVLAVVAIGLAGLFAAIGIVEEATHRLIYYTSSVEIGNAYSSFFRVTSLFRDPSLYGRHVVLGIGVALVLVWYRRLGLVLGTAFIALLFAGLFFSYSQSSFAALFAIALFTVLVAGDRPVRVVATAMTIVILAGGAVYGVHKLSTSSTQRVTSDRSRRVALTARVFAHHPIVGVGIGSQPRASQQISSEGGAPTLFVSHTTPLTVAAELGVAGLALYAFLLGGAGAAVGRVGRLDPVLGLALAVVFVGLLVHSVLYSGFFEDPLTWLVLGVIGAFLGSRARDASL